MKRELRTIWNSNGVHTNSGYGVFQRDLLFRLAKDGWPVAQTAFWGLEGYPITQHGEDLIDDRFKDAKIKMYPKMADVWGADAMVYHSMDFKANAVFTMQDIWPLDVNALKQLKVFIPYVPIDKDPVPPLVLERLKYAYKIITFSKFGQKALEKAGFTSTLILEGTDTEIFKPMDREACRRGFGLPLDAFMFGMVAANKENPPRKGFEEALRAFKMFLDKHPEGALMLHTQQQSPQGFPIKQFAHYLGIDQRIFFMDDYHAIFMSDSHIIAKEMNAFDVLLHPSQTEGFGLTVIEANSCGIPAIVNNCTSMPEMVVDGKTGFVCEHGTPRFTNDESVVYPADVNSLYEKMELIYELLKKNPNKVKNDCRKHIVKNYNIDTIFKEQWVPFYEELERDLLTPKK